MKKQTQNSPRIAFQPGNKKSFEEFSIEELRGWVVSRLIDVEKLINQAILNHFDPKYKIKFESVVLNSSVLSMGSKLKILKNIDGFNGDIIGKIQKLNSIRNSFAHTNVKNNAFLESENDDDFSITDIFVQSTIDVMKSNGEIKSKIALTYLNEFDQLYKEVIAALTPTTPMH